MLKLFRRKNIKRNPKNHSLNYLLDKGFKVSARSFFKDLDVYFRDIPLSERLKYTQELINNLIKIAKKINKRTNVKLDKDFAYKFELASKELGYNEKEISKELVVLNKLYSNPFLYEIKEINNILLRKVNNQPIFKNDFLLFDNFFKNLYNALHGKESKLEPLKPNLKHSFIGMIFKKYGNKNTLAEKYFRENFGLDYDSALFALNLLFSAKYGEKLDFLEKHFLNIHGIRIKDDVDIDNYIKLFLKVLDKK